MKTHTVYLLVIASAFFWGANFVLAGPVLVDLSPLWAAAARFALGALLMLGFAVWRGEDLVGPLRSHAWAYLLLGAVGISAFNLLFFFALQHTSAVNAALIMASNPLLTTLLAAVLLRERANARQLASIPLALLGVSIVISGGEFHRLTALHDVRGDLLMLGANFAWAFYNVLGRRYLPKTSSITNTTLLMSAGAVLLLLAALSHGGLPQVPGPKAMLALAMMIGGGTVLAYVFWNTGIAYLGAGRTALFLNLVPVFAMLIGIISGVLPTLPQLIGGVLVISGISLSMLPRRSPPVKTLPANCPAD
jgi:drug/metabolite transporter (DMT)-like permease